MNNQLVSVIIPVYNGSSYVAQAIDSVLAQTWPFIEIIVVDDGSDDGGATHSIVARYGDAVRFIRKPNGGVGSALNTGISAMRGDWFSWLSHDDLYLPNRVERYMQVLKSAPPQSIAFGEVDLVDERGQFVRTAGFLNGVSDERDARWLALEGRLNGCAMLIPRSCLPGEEPFNTALPTTQDYALWFDLASRFPFVPVQEALVLSRVHEEQGSRHPRHLEEASLLWLQMIERMERESPLSEPLHELRRLRRVQRFLRQTTYRGAHVYIDRRVRQKIKELDVALVCFSDTVDQLMQGLQVISSTGATCSELIVIDGSDDAASAWQWDSLRLPTLRQIVRIPRRFASANIVLTTAWGHSGASVLVVLDSSAHVDTEAITEGIQVLAADEADAWMGTSTSASCLGALHGAAIRRTAVADVVAAGAQGYPMLGLHARIAVAYTPPIPFTSGHASTSTPSPPPTCTSTERAPLRHMPRKDRPTLLILVHAMGGGTIRYAELIAAAIGGRANILFAWGTAQNTFTLSSSGPDTAELSYELPSQMADIVDDLRTLGVARVDVVHSIGMDDHLDELLSRLGVPFDITLVDYHQVSTQPHLVDERGAFVGDDALRRADHPLIQARSRGRLRAADRVIACSRDLAARFGRLSGVQNVIPVRIPEPGNPDQFAIHATPIGVNEWMRVLFLGAIAQHKGVHLLSSVASLLRQYQIPVRIECLGSIHIQPDQDALTNVHLRFWGRYETRDLHALMCGIRPHLAWLPFTAPETHSFALSEVMLQGLPVLTTGVGAIPERLHGRPSSWILTEDEATPDRIVMWIDRLRRERLTTAARWLPVDHLPPLRSRFYVDEYLRPLYRARP